MAEGILPDKVTISLLNEELVVTIQKYHQNCKKIF